MHPFLLSGTGPCLRRLRPARPSGALARRRRPRSTARAAPGWPSARCRPTRLATAPITAGPAARPAYPRPTTFASPDPGRAGSARPPAAKTCGTTTESPAPNTANPPTTAPGSRLTRAAVSPAVASRPQPRLRLDRRNPRRPDARGHPHDKEVRGHPLPRPAKHGRAGITHGATITATSARPRRHRVLFRGVGRFRRAPTGRLGVPLPAGRALGHRFRPADHLRIIFRP